MTPAPLRVLVVEDNDVYRRGLVEVLRSEGFEIDGVASTAAEAIRACGESCPEIVLLDLELPDGSGIEAIEAMAERCPNARVVVLTASDDRADLIRSLRAGAVGYMTKDESPEGLARALRGLVNGEAPLSRQLATYVVEEVQREDRRRELAALVPDPDHLTPRQLEILHMLAGGATTAGIAQDLFLSVETVRWHVKSILRKLGVRSRAEAIACLEELRTA